MGLYIRLQATLKKNDYLICLQVFGAVTGQNDITSHAHAFECWLKDTHFLPYMFIYFYSIVKVLNYNCVYCTNSPCCWMFKIGSLSLQMDYIAGSFYDGFVLYAKALEETLADGGAQNDGINITMRTQNRRFWGKQTLFHLVKTGKQAMSPTYDIISLL